jgi:transcriptional regulator with XRE-family HTH domain
MKPKRSNQKKITKEALVLRHMRISKKISLNQAGRLVGISGSAITHMEQGRMDLSRLRIQTLVQAYGYTLDDYLELLERKELPLNRRDECLSIIRQLDETKLLAVHAVLMTMLPPMAFGSSFATAARQ